MKLSKIFIYDEPSVPEIEINQLAEFIEKIIGAKVEVRKNIFNHYSSNRKTAYELASLRVFNPYSPFNKHIPVEEEINIEERSFTNSGLLSNITLYDGFEFQNLLREMIPEDELSLDKLHIVFTTRLTCTYDYEDYRYHGRAIICSNPSIISTTGIIEAPAKPRAYYLDLHKTISQGLNLDSLKNQFKGKFLEYHDKNLSKVARGYALQAVFYHLTGEPFCNSKDCILYNAHWQQDLLHAQINFGIPCNNHQKILDNIRKCE